jgi:hypothetical protein
MTNESTSFRNRAAIPWPVFEAGLWIRAGISGAAVALVSPAMAFNGEVSPMTGAIALAAGALVAVFAYRRTRKLLGADVASPVDAVSSMRGVTQKPIHDSRVRSASVHAA